jgi:hypothetical protein
VVGIKKFKRLPRSNKRAVELIIIIIIIIIIITIIILIIMHYALFVAKYWLLKQLRYTEIYVNKFHIISQSLVEKIESHRNTVYVFKRDNNNNNNNNSNNNNNDNDDISMYVG